MKSSNDFPARLPQPIDHDWDESSTEEGWRNDVGYTGRKPSLDDYDRWDK